MVWRRTPGAVSCSAPNWSWEVQTPELAACQSAPAQAARLAWARRPRRLSPLPWPSPLGLRERAPARCAWRKAHHGRGAPAASADGFFEVGIAVGTQATPPSCPSLALVQEVSDCARCPLGRRLAPPMLCSWPSRRRSHRGRSGPSVVLACAWMQFLEAAEDGHVAGLWVRRALWREEAQHDVRECGPHAVNVASLAWMLAMSQRRIHDCPSLPGLSTLSRAAARVVSALRPGAAQARRRLSCRRARPAPACPAGHGPMLKAIVNVVASLVLPLQLGLFRAAAAPSGLMHREEAA